MLKHPFVKKPRKTFYLQELVDTLKTFQLNGPRNEEDDDGDLTAKYVLQYPFS